MCKAQANVTTGPRSRLNLHSRRPFSVDGLCRPPYHATSVENRWRRDTSYTYTHKTRLISLTLSTWWDIVAGTTARIAKKTALHCVYVRTYMQHRFPGAKFSNRSESCFFGSASDSFIRVITNHYRHRFPPSLPPPLLLFFSLFFAVGVSYWPLSQIQKVCG